MTHIPTLIGGPADGQSFVPQPGDNRVVVPCLTMKPWAPEPESDVPYSDELYERRTLALGGPHPRRATFFAHAALDGHEACARMWDHLMSLAGAA